MEQPQVHSDASLTGRSDAPITVHLLVSHRVLALLDLGMLLPYQGNVSKGDILRYAQIARLI